MTFLREDFLLILFLVVELMSLVLFLFVLFLEICDGRGALGRNHIDLVRWAHLLMMQELLMLQRTEVE